MHKFRLNADGKMLTGIFILIYAQQIIGLGLTQPGAQVPNFTYTTLLLSLSLPFSHFACSCKFKTKCDMIMILIIYSLLSSDIGTCC